MKRRLYTDKFEFTYSENHVETHVLWDRHCHARYEMIGVLEGDISIMLEGRSYRLTENQLIMIPPLFYHTVTANKEGDYKRITAQFDIQAIPAVLRKDFQAMDAEPVIFTSAALRDMAVCFEEEPDPYFVPLVDSLMVPLFYSRLRAVPAAPGRDADDEADAFLLRIVEYVDEHLCERITLEHLARHTARSQSFVCHRFEEKMGIPPGQYILRKKMAYAQKLIKEGQPATLVAAQIGYKNYGTFYRIYTKHFHKLPSKD